MSTASINVRRSKVLSRRRDSDDATKYLLATRANHEHLEQALAEFERGETVTRSLT